jgi:hypothetical protein
MIEFTKKEFNEALDEGTLTLGRLGVVVTDNGNEYIIKSEEVGNEVILYTSEELEKLEEPKES